jgi:hypothetical protein
MKEFSRIINGLLIFGAILCANISSFAQKKPTTPGEKKPFMERIYLGGSLGFGISTKSTLIDVSPVVGYALTDELIPGLGFTYKYYQYNDYYLDLGSNETTDLKTNMYGISVFVRYFLTKTEIPVIENTFLHAEVEPLIFVNNYTLVPFQQGNYIDVFGNYYTKEKDAISLTGIFLGGGYRQLINEKAYLYIEVLWNFNEELYSPYSNPRIRIGVAAGL